MKIDLAVYTGESGYSWHHAGAFTNEELTVYKRIMGKFPDPDFGRMSFGGAFNEGSWLVFYRYHYARRWDNLGRDSLYVVLGRVPLALASSVDFKCVFALTEMNQPIKPFPTETTYIGPKASAAPSFSSQRLFTGTVALSYLGFWFATKPEGRLVVSIDGDYANPRVLPRFEPVASPVTPDPIPSTPTFSSRSSGGWTPGSGVPDAIPASKLTPHPVSLTTCLALSLGFFALGGVAGYALHAWVGKDDSLSGKISERVKKEVSERVKEMSEKVTEATGYKIDIEKIPPRPKQGTSPVEVCPTNSSPSRREEFRQVAEPQRPVTNRSPIQVGLDKLDRKIREATTNVVQKIGEELKMDARPQ